MLLFLRAKSYEYLFNINPPQIGSRLIKKHYDRRKVIPVQTAKTCPFCCDDQVSET